MKRLLKWGLIVAVAGFVLMQLIPYGRTHENPPIKNEFAWDSPETKALAQQSCFACHSNETVWPWYSNIAPVSWLVQFDTVEGRESLNFSDWGQGGEGESGGEMAETIREGEMPPPIYLITNPDAKLSQMEKEQLIRGLLATTGNQPSSEGDDDDD